MHDWIEAELPARPLMRIVRSIRTDEGTGFLVNRTMPQESLPFLDPFVLLDELGPVLPAGHTEGYDDHPHCGLEVLTYIVDGTMINAEPGGAHNVECSTGGAVWMSFGAGAVHMERPTDEVIGNGGRCHALQLWMALPSSAKKSRPAAKGFESTEIAEMALSEGRVTARVVAGKAFGMTGPATPINPVLYIHLAIRPGGSVVIDIPPGENAFAYTIEGQLHAGADRAPVPAGRAGLFVPSVGPALLSVPEDGVATQAVFMSAPQTGEPIMRRAVFVMNTEEELAACFQEYGHYLGLPVQPAPGARLAS